MSDKMREAFEKWAVSEGMPITRGHYYDVYASAETRAAYLAWQAAQSVPKDKPTECANGCPEKQVCDYCQSMDAALRLIAVNREVVELHERIRQLEKELGEALMEQAVAVIGEPVAILRRQIGEDTWFDWTPVLPNSKTHKQLKAAGEMDYCEVYQRYTQSIPASKLAALREKAESVSEGWKGWRDVYVHGYPEAAQEVLFARGGITVHGAFIGGIFWHSNEKCAAALWMPLPTPLTPDEHRAMLAATAQEKA